MSSIITSSNSSRSKYIPDISWDNQLKNATLPLRKSPETYEEIKARCIRENRLYEDEDFPGFGLPYLEEEFEEKYEIVWKRPQEFLGNSASPEFFVGETNRFDIKQRLLGDCWFLAALATTCEREDLFKRLVPPGQNFKRGNYAGIFRFNFWWFGEWTEVIIDDRLPVCGEELASLRSSERNEFWSPLFEKAFAKLNGGYQNLRGGNAYIAFQHFTGGIGENYTIPLKSCPPSDFWKLLMKSAEKGTLMSAGTFPRSKDLEEKTGLYGGHAYSVTDIREVSTLDHKKEQLIRIRNPWGTSTEWTGDWNDSSPKWNAVSQKEKQRIGLAEKPDGEFWMSFDDFMSNFNDIDICHLAPDAVSTDDRLQMKKNWNRTQYRGRWESNITAGGSGQQEKYKSLYFINPQFSFEIVESVDEGDESLIIALLQMDPETRKLTTKPFGVSVYKLDENQRNRKEKFITITDNATPVYKSGYTRANQIVERVNLPKGHYCVIPSCQFPGYQADFLLRIYTEKPVVVKKMEQMTTVRSSKKSEDILKENLRKKKNKKKDEEEPETDSEPSIEDWKIVERAKEAMKLIAREESEIDAFELQAILNFLFVREFKFDGFSSETCKQIVASRDFDLSGKLGFEECIEFLGEVFLWALVFKVYEDEDGNIDCYFLREMMEELGIELSFLTFRALVHRYSHRNGKIYFDDFIHGATRLTSTIMTYRDMLKDNPETKFNLDQYILATL